MRVVAFSLVQYQVPFSVHRLKVRLYTRGLVRLFALVRPYIQLYAPLFADLGDKGAEHLLEKRVLKLVVLHVAVDRGLVPYVLKHLHIPVYELGVE